MTIKSKVNKDYTVIPNYILKEENLSMQSKFLLIYVISLPSDFEVSLNGLSRALSNEAGRVTEAAIRKCLKELKEVGYVVRVFDKDESGRMVGSHYDFYDTPQTTTRKVETVQTKEVESNLPSDKQKLLNEYLEYRKQMYRISPKSQKKKFKELKSITHITNLFQKHSIEDLTKAVEQTMINEWSGIFVKETKKQQPVINKFEMI
jgi:hypothetical protein